MADQAEGPWVPARPSSQREVWAEPPMQDPSRQVGTAPEAPLQASWFVPAGAAPRSRRGAVRRGWDRVSVGRRILLSYTALAAAILLVVGVGSAVQPSYGDLSPWQGITVDDIRSAPTTSDWALDLASVLVPGSPTQCLRFVAMDVGQDLVVVRAESASSFGYSTDAVCTAVASGFESRVALLDTANGAVPWVHDTASDLPTAQGVEVTWASTFDHGSKLLIQAESATQSIVESLSMSTGQVIGSTGAMVWSDEDRFTATGSVVALGVLSPDQLTFTYEVKNANDLRTTVWSGQGNETSTMIALSDRLLLGTERTEQILLATGVASPWGPALDTALGYAVHDDTVFAVRTGGTGVTTARSAGFSALSKTGKVLWRSTFALRGNYSLTRSCLAVTDQGGNQLACLDYTTGKVTWSVGLGGFASAASAVGQRSDDLFAIAGTGRFRVIDLDGKTGRQRFAADIPAGSSIIAAGQTVGYALTVGITGSTSTIIAFDLSSGRQLWSETSPLQLGLWGGHLIDIRTDGFARRLVLAP